MISDRPGRRAAGAGRVIAVCMLIVAAVAGAAVYVAVRFAQPAAAPATAAALPVPAGNPLVATFAGAGNECNRYVFDRDNAAAGALVAPQKWPADLDAKVRQVLATGGYARRDVTIRFVLQTRGSQPVAVTGLRLVDIRPAATIEGADLSFDTCPAKSAGQLAIPINAADRGPFKTDKAGRATSQRFFDATTITVAPGTQQGVVLTVTIDEKHRAGSYEFNVELTYAVDGGVATQVIDNAGRPFRLTAQACPPDSDTRTTDGRPGSPLRKTAGKDDCD